MGLATPRIDAAAHERPAERPSPTPRATGDAPHRPPPRVSRAFVGAILAEAHLRAVWGEPPVGPRGAPRPEVLARLHPAADREELLQRLDRRAARLLRQARALDWMWTRFGLDRGIGDQDLFRALFPGRGREAVRFVRRNAQLYALVDGEAGPGAALFLPWTADPELAVAPLGGFRARAVDPGLRLALRRAVGTDDAELDVLLESMVCLLPRARAEALIGADAWRVSGCAALSGLGLPYTAAGWLTRPPRDEEITWRRWLDAEGGRLRSTVEPRLVFDGLAARRAEVMMRQIYTGLLSGVADGRPEAELLDVRRHLAAVLQPLLAWPRDPEAQRRVATGLGLPVPIVAAGLSRVADRWSRQAARVWLAAPDAEQPYTVHGVLLEHLLRLRGSLGALARRPADPRRPHGRALLLFAGHHLAAAPLERLWLGALSDMPTRAPGAVPPAEDVPGAWFWGCWTRLLDAVAPQPGRNAPRPPA